MRPRTAWVTVLIAVLTLSACTSGPVADPADADVPTIGVLRSVLDLRVS